MSQDFFSAGFIPGAVVYFSTDAPKGKFMISNLTVLEAWVLVSHSLWGIRYKWIDLLKGKVQAVDIEPSFCDIFLLF